MAVIWLVIQWLAWHYVATCHANWYGELGPTADLFEDIYDTKQWSKEGGISPSGPGSDVGSLDVEAVRKFVQSVVLHHTNLNKTVRLADAPCGDLGWIGLLLIDLLRNGYLIAYRGYDIVDVTARGALERLLSSYAHESLSVEVGVLDLTMMGLPYPADVVLVKDLVNHLPLDLGHRVLCNIVASVADDAILILTSNKLLRGGGNQEVRLDNIGYDSRPRDLQKPPFFFPLPLVGTNSLGAWRAAALVERCPHPETEL